MHQQENKKPESLKVILYRIGVGIGVGVCVFFSGRINYNQEASSDALQRIELNVNGMKTRLNTVESNLDNHIYDQGRINISIRRDINNLKEFTPEFRQN